MHSALLFPELLVPGLLFPGIKSGFKSRAGYDSACTVDKKNPLSFNYLDQGAPVHVFDQEANITLRTQPGCLAHKLVVSFFICVCPCIYAHE